MEQQQQASTYLVVIRNDRQPFFTYKAPIFNDEGPSTRYFFDKGDWPVLILMNTPIAVEWSSRHLTINLKQMQHLDLEKFSSIADSCCEYFICENFFTTGGHHHHNPLRASPILTMPISRRCLYKSPNEKAIVTTDVADLRLSIRGVWTQPHLQPIIAVDEITGGASHFDEEDYEPQSCYRSLWSPPPPSYEPAVPYEPKHVGPDVPPSPSYEPSPVSMMKSYI